ncbi:hypothetical protein [Anoxybacterium hadale]|uniref:hypothetical protein n=1 Tax=Anoxybacterium hadale TaxID=3408580 RepID=UPI003AFFFB8C
MDASKSANIHPGFYDWNQSGFNDLLANLELLRNHILGSFAVGIFDHRAHFGSEYVLLSNTLQKIVFIASKTITFLNQSFQV